MVAARPPLSQTERRTSNLVSVTACTGSKEKKQQPSRRAYHRRCDVCCPARTGRNTLLAQCRHHAAGVRRRGRCCERIGTDRNSRGYWAGGAAAPAREANAACPCQRARGQVSHLGERTPNWGGYSSASVSQLGILFFRRAHPNSVYYSAARSARTLVVRAQGRRSAIASRRGRSRGRAAYGSSFATAAGDH